MSRIAKHMVPLFMVMIMGCSTVPLAPDAVQEPPRSCPRATNLVPEPWRLTAAEGHFRLDSSTRIVTDGTSEEIEWSARELAARLKAVTGLDVPVTNAPAADAGFIRITTGEADPLVGAEGYELVVRTNSVLARAPTAAGLFYACQTLRQLFDLNAVRLEEGGSQAALAIPCMKIMDKPRFPWRGFMLDSARHFQKVEAVERLMDWLAYYKINRFHWHLNDDQAWRLEIEKYPLLTQIGAWPASKEESMGGFYSRADVQRILSYARRRNIVVIPEIEMPGHAAAATYCYPQFTCRGEPWPHGEESPWYFFYGGETTRRKPYCASRPETVVFLQDILAETMRMFDSPYIHIGGDERPGGWSQCERCIALMAEKGLRDENMLQNWMMDRVSAFVHSNDVRTISWAYNLKDGIPAGQIVQGWHEGESAEAARMGADTINSECGYVYLDFHWPPLDPKAVYSFNPVPTNLTPAQAEHILGSEAPLWTEMVSDEATVFQRVFPRLIAFSEVVWSPQETRQYDIFEKCMRAHVGLFDKLGVPHRELDPYPE